MAPTTFKIDLSGRGGFLVTTEDGQFHKGRFSMYALDRFCVAKGVESYLTLIYKLTVGMTLRDYADLVLIALQDYFREDIKQCHWTADKVMDEIFEPAGGMASKKLLQLFTHAVGRISEYTEAAPTDEAATDDEKKSLSAEPNT